MVLSGLHATTVSNYQNICCEGFKQGPGLRGSGVYFWDDEEGFAITKTIFTNLSMLGMQA